MRKLKGPPKTATDPFQFAALLSIFQGPEEFVRGSNGEVDGKASTDPMLSVVNRIGEDDSVVTALKGSIANHPLPCLIVSEDGQIVSINEPAYEALDLEISDSIDSCGLKAFDSGTLVSKIDDVINFAGKSRQQSLFRAFFEDETKPVTLAILPNRAPEKSVKTALIFFLDIGGNGAVGDFISTAYDLTKSEQKVLEMFILGDDLEQIAENRGRSFKTVRTQFYSALSKCGLTSQVDLVREIVAGSLFQSLLPQTPPAEKHPHRKELTLLRPNGRTLEVIMAGDFEGAPVLLLSSIGTQKVAPRKERKMFEASVCVYSISPPGYGRTSPPLAGKDRLDCLHDDVNYVLEQLELEKAPFISFGTSIVPTLRLARRMPERMTGIVSYVTSPPSPYHKQHDQGNSASALAAMRNAIMAFPAMKSLTVRSAVRAWAVFGTRKMAKIQCRSEPSAAPFLLDPETVKSIDEGFRSSILQGFSHVIRDTEEHFSDWRDDVEACPVPITIVHGQRDKTTDISIVRSFVDDFPHKLQLVEIADAGAFLHVTHEDLYIEMLQEFARK